MPWPPHKRNKPRRLPALSASRPASTAIDSPASSACKQNTASTPLGHKPRNNNRGKREGTKLCLCCYCCYLLSSWASWGPSSSHLGASWWPLGGILGHLGVLGPSWGLLGPSWGYLGASWGLLGSSWGHLGPISGPSWGQLGASWGFLRAFWGHLGLQKSVNTCRERVFFLTSVCFGSRSVS